MDQDGVPTDNQPNDTELITMSNENSPPPTPPSPTARRASFAPGQKFSELFGRSPGSSGSATGISAHPGPIVAAAANAQAQQRRRMSISTLGLAGSPTQTSPFAGTRARQGSYSSTASGSGSLGIDESAVEEGDAVPNNTPTSPFARRISFGARAMRDVRTGPGNLNGRASTSSASSPSVKGRGLSSSPETALASSKKASNHFSRPSGEGFNWSDQLRSRAERSSSITSPPIPPPASPSGHQRAVSVTVMEPPVKEMPKTPRAPDHFQERILKGDFYMD
ncbi:hypothetical protein MMC24_007602 [Lignoscripta atroalba]|nr:hypothetical protein [Lignoscripta atroalba]